VVMGAAISSHPLRVAVFSDPSLATFLEV
jgi:hypothetical protein